jgi:uncharacterized protein
MMRRLAAAATVLALLLLGCSSDDESGPQVVVGEAAPISLEVADDDAERRVGLMGRAEVPPGTGMVFVYDEPVTNPFWMGNVEVPLSIAWVLDDRVVGVAEMQPCPAADSSCPRYSPGTAYDHAVETASGTFTDAGVRPGDPVTFTNLD